MSKLRLYLKLGIPLLALTIGVAYAIRFADLNEGLGESGAAAVNLLRDGVLGNPFRVPTGPTAHVSPAVGAVLAVTYKLFGSGTHEARVALGILAAALYASAAWVVFAGCKTMRMSTAAVCGAAAAFVCCPMFLFLSVVYFRQWDQPFAALLLPLGWLAYERGRSTGEMRNVVLLAGIAGVGSLFSPALLTSLLPALALLVWHGQRVASAPLLAPWRAIASGLLAAGIVAAFMVPWGIRNEAQLGRFVLTRSNFGLELWLGNAPGALGWSNPGQGFAHHPYSDVAMATDLARVGEVAYMDAKEHEALAIIEAQPARFARLTLKRVWLCFFPEAGMVGWHPGLGTVIPWLMLTLFGVAKLGSLIVVSMTRRRALTCWLFSAAPLLPYTITHVNLRYAFATYFTSVLVIAVAIDAVSASRRADWTRTDVPGLRAAGRRQLAPPPITS